MAFNKTERILLWISVISILIVILVCGIFIHWAISFIAVMLLISAYMTQFGSVDFKFMNQDESSKKEKDE